MASSNYCGAKLIFTVLLLHGIFEKMIYRNKKFEIVRSTENSGINKCAKYGLLPPNQRLSHHGQCRIATRFMEPWSKWLLEQNQLKHAIIGLVRFAMAGCCCQRNAITDGLKYQSTSAITRSGKTNYIHFVGFFCFIFHLRRLSPRDFLGAQGGLPLGY